EDNQTRPAEPMYRIEENANYGWPFCFFDFVQNKLLLNPEYGGDGKTVGRCTEFKTPVAAFPAHWAPVDVMFYTGSQFPAKYRGGAFIAFHGSWNRSPAVQDGYNVTFQPFAAGKPSGKFEVFADGFAGAQAPRASARRGPTARPRMAGAGGDGPPDVTFYIVKTKRVGFGRVFYPGKNGG